MPVAQDLVIFTQTYDLLTWLLPQCERFPKSQRFVVTQRLMAAALDFQEAIFEANARSGAHRLQHLAWQIEAGHLPAATWRRAGRRVWKRLVCRLQDT